MLEEARRAVQIDVEPLPAIFTIEDSLAKRAIIFGDDNIFKSYHVEKGDVDAAWAQADIIVEGEYRTGAQEQLYIENQGMIAHGKSGRWRDGLGFAAVPVLRAQSPDASVRTCPRTKFA